MVSEEKRQVGQLENEALAWLDVLVPAGETVSTWGTSSWGSLSIRTRSYVSTAVPPAELVTSVRCIVLRGLEAGDLVEVLVMRNRDGRHIWPGGRREGNETPEQTLRRELLEEAGCTVGAPVYLGFLHLRHLGSKPDGYPYLFPNFLQLVYAARAVHVDPEARLPDDYELGSAFEPVESVRHELSGLGEPAFLDAALKALSGHLHRSRSQ
jgi:8-oxo-dGTP pyrophosphatase MutT (NUDIX family)